LQQKEVQLCEEQLQLSVFVFHAPDPGHLTLSCWGDEVFRYEQGSLVAPERKVHLHDLLFKRGSIVRVALVRTCESMLDAIAKPRFSLPGDNEWRVSEVAHGL
jgi:hypothetical protein